MNEAYDILDEQGQHYSKPTAFNYSQYLYSYRYKVVREHMRGPDVLEVGVGYGDFSSWLSEESFRLIYRSALFVAALRVLYKATVSLT